MAASKTPGIASSVDSDNTHDGPLKKLGVPAYSCQFAGDTLSMLSDTDDVCWAREHLYERSELIIV